MPSFFYFDIGNVLLRFDNDRMMRQVAAVAGVDAAAVREALLPTGERTDPQWRFESGDLSEDAYYELVCEALGVRPPRAELERAASDIFTPIDETMRLVDRLHAAGHRLGLLSNTNGYHWRFFTDGRYPALASRFEVGVGSHEARALKPDAAIYEIAVERAGVPAEEVFFTDDREENIAGALEFGIEAVVFTDAAALEAELRSRGVALD